MSNEQTLPLLYQAELRSTEVLTSEDAAELRARRQSVMQQSKPSFRAVAKRYLPVAISCTLLAALWILPSQEAAPPPEALTVYESSRLIAPSTWAIQDSTESAIGEDWALYNDWAFYDWLEEEQLAEAY